MKIRDLVKESGLSERMLRHYEALGILKPSRSKGGTREFSQTDLAIALLIQRFRTVEIPLDVLAEIAQERRNHQTGESSQQAVSSLLKALARQLSEKAEQSLALHRIVLEASDAVKACKGCENQPSTETCPDCPMNDASKENAVAAMIWNSG